MVPEIAHESTQTCYLLASVGPGGSRGLGSCFALGGNRVATALHVVSAGSGAIHLVVPRDDPAGYQDMTNDGYNIIPTEIVAADPIHDLAILEVPNIETRVSWRITGTDTVRTGDAVATLGFPHADTGRVVLTEQRTSVGARVLMGNQGIKSKYLVLNTLLRPGQSGGPVINMLTGELVAILVGAYVTEDAQGRILIGNVDPVALHQTTHAISAEYLQEMIAS